MTPFLSFLLAQKPESVIAKSLDDNRDDVAIFMKVNVKNIRVSAPFNI